MVAPIRDTLPHAEPRAGSGAGEEFRRVAAGVMAEPRLSATARRWSHRSLQEADGVTAR